ncbi:hypothetical protein, partial [Paenibacillus jilunlii]|uniref:hypothetical protein n=1 Tax=Paenibacillus jilunlii TaxID=682956 RepID=UPI001B80C675
MEFELLIVTYRVFTLAVYRDSVPSFKSFRPLSCILLFFTPFNRLMTIRLFHFSFTGRSLAPAFCSLRYLSLIAPAILFRSYGLLHIASFLPMDTGQLNLV